MYYRFKIKYHIITNTFTEYGDMVQNNYYTINKVNGEFIWKNSLKNSFSSIFLTKMSI